MGFVSTNKHPFFEPTVRKCFNSFVVSSVCLKTRRRESQFKCRCRYKDATSWKFLWLSDYGLWPTHYNKMPKRWKDACCQNQSNVQETKSWEQCIIWRRARQSRNWTQRRNHYQVFHPPIRKTPNIGTVLKLFHRPSWFKQVRRIGEGYGFSASSS